jgi:hypothetical protein
MPVNSGAPNYQLARATRISRTGPGRYILQSKFHKGISKLPLFCSCFEDSKFLRNVDVCLQAGRPMSIKNSFIWSSNLFTVLCLKAACIQSVPKMYTHFIILTSKEDSYQSVFVAFLKVSNIRNVHTSVNALLTTQCNRVAYFFCCL